MLRVPAEKHKPIKIVLGREQACRRQRSGFFRARGRWILCHSVVVAASKSPEEWGTSRRSILHPSLVASRGRAHVAQGFHMAWVLTGLLPFLFLADRQIVPSVERSTAALNMANGEPLYLFMHLDATGSNAELALFGREKSGEGMFNRDIYFSMDCQWSSSLLLLPQDHTLLKLHFEVFRSLDAARSVTVHEDKILNSLGVQLAVGNGDFVWILLNCLDFVELFGDFELLGNLCFLLLSWPKCRRCKTVLGKAECDSLSRRAMLRHAPFGWRKSAATATGAGLAYSSRR
ncbi:hypothetical protein C8F04DRAFT_1178140 [Mycena alexandri]|uniref:Uncharacterized protein n=1 Tax=Mycena alexandri TaxID=1745969 RepID=A0AAD6T6N1_9AGAR|nr:hypothetical protein C8F04DRAFT_1178140 [Mycena alexandri]